MILSEYEMNTLTKINLMHIYSRILKNSIVILFNTSNYF